jgi:putative PIN family toxin of toxin-antitoxin system
MIRAVLDSNVIVSGVIRQEGPPGQLLKAALVTGKFTLVASPFLLQEVAETLWEEKIRKYHRWDRKQLLVFVRRLHRQSQVTPGAASGPGDRR